MTTNQNFAQVANSNREVNLRMQAQRARNGGVRHKTRKGSAPQFFYGWMV